MQSTLRPGFASRWSYDRFPVLRSAECGPARSADAKKSIHTSTFQAPRGVNTLFSRQGGVEC
eukprot:6381482-Prymnesium_polylepis.1